MTAVEVFQFPATGQQVRTVIRDGSPWFVARDVCGVLDIGNPSQTVRSLDDDEYETVPAALITTEARPQDFLILVTEAGLYSLILRSRKPEAKAFKRWVTHEVLPAIRKTGRYEVARLGDPLDEIEQANERVSRAVAIAREERAGRLVAEAQVAQLEPRAATLDAIEAGDGLTPRAFHKKYFSDVSERDFFEHLYRRGYLIDQRGKGRWSTSQQAYRPGSQHRHPSHKGKPFFYLHTSLDEGEVRRENTRVRPGDPEIALRDRLVREGLPPNSNSAIEKRSA